MKTAYINFLNHCYVDTEVEMKEIYTSNHLWTLFETFLVDMAMVSKMLLYIIQRNIHCFEAKLNCWKKVKKVERLFWVSKQCFITTGSD